MFTSLLAFQFMAISISSTQERVGWLKDDRPNMTSCPCCSFFLWVGWGRVGWGGGGVGWGWGGGGVGGGGGVSQD
jgi:hypothetical protein